MRQKDADTQILKFMYLHYLYFSDYCPHLCRHVYHNVSAVVRSGLLQVVGMSKGLSSTFQSPEKGQNAQRPKRCDKHDDKDEENSLKNINNVHKISSQKYRRIMYILLGNV